MVDAAVGNDHGPLTDGVLILDRAGLVATCNPAAELLLRGCHGPFIGAALPVLLAGAEVRSDEGDLAGLVDPAVAIGPGAGEISWPDGDDASRASLDVTVVGLAAEAGSGLVVVLRDAAAPAARWRHLLRREQEFRSLVEHSADMIVRTRPDGEITFVSAAVRSVLGYEPQQLVGCRTVDLIHPDDVAERGRRLGAIDAFRAPLPVELRLLRADGGWEWCEATVRAVHDEAGVVVERHGTIRSIERRRLAHSLLVQALARYRTLATHLPGGAVFLLDAQRRYELAVGPALTALTAGVDVTSRRPEEVFDAATAAVIVDAFEAALTGETRSWRASDSAGRSYDMTMTPVLEDGVVVSGMALAFDVTERAILEQEQAVLLELSRVVAQNPGAGEVLALAVSRVAALFGAVEAAVFRFEDDGWATTLASAPMSPEELTPAGRVFLAPTSAIGRVAATGHTAVVADYGDVDDPLVCSLRALGAVGGLAAPISIAGRLWGALAVGGAVTERLDLATADRLARFAELLATTVANAEAWETLAHLAATDPLTGLPNSRTLHARFDDEIARAGRYHHPLAVVLIDIDHFKRINDTLGHQVGDQALAGVAALLASVTRAGELLARIGGEEFAWLLPETDAAGAVAAADRARLLIAATSVGDDLHVTASFGVSVFDPALDGVAAGADDLAGRADRALYRAKREGRNRVVLEHPDDADGPPERPRQTPTIASVRALARAIDAKDLSTRRHSERVAALAEALANELGWAPARVEALHEAALLHDVGKIGIRDQILLKPGPLTAAEVDDIKRHSLLGAEITADVLTAEQVQWVRGHHERHDGSGYPDGLAGAAIPDGARVLAVADAYDAMTSIRTYQETRPPPDAVAECIAHRGSQFTPEVVDALVRLADADRLPAVEHG
jgi:diguanylate cyclase (GGDEF)-like protein/PAS domain S-box-containing protein/putative nucleotidyltransferase with HDIG domain